MSNTLSDLTNGGKRTKTHDAQIVTKLPRAAKELLEKAAEAQGFTLSDISRIAFAEYLERRGYGR